jgi:formylglycine-generating enzyme required for sulfatase activity
VGVTAFPMQTSIEISWADPIDTLKYALYWQEGDTVIAVGATRVDRIKPPYVLNGLSIGKTYSFYCTSIGSSESRQSQMVSAMTQGPCRECGMKRLAGGAFIMGDSTIDFNGGAPVHHVTLSPFFIDTTEVTAIDFSSLMGGQKYAISYFGTLCPAVEVSWFEAIVYCNKRSRRDGLDSVYRYSSMGFSAQYPWRIVSLAGLSIDFSKNGYRLPTEPEWEYACRGGTRTKYPWGDTWNPYYANMSIGKTYYNVAKMLPNNFGLYDMLGNACEWTTSVDDYTDNAVDPEGSIANVSRMSIRGGCAGDNQTLVHPAVRASQGTTVVYTTTGFRVVRRDK